MELYGWDTVFACSNSRINDCLKSDMQSTILAFDYEENGIRITGTFGAWQIVKGGSDSLLHFQTPIQTGSITAMGQTFDLAGVEPVLELQLDFIENDDKQGGKNLRFNCSVIGAKPGDTTSGAVTMVTPDLSGKLTGIGAEILHDNLPKCIIKERDKLAYVFASIGNPGRQNWLTPKRFAYLYSEAVADQNGSLIVFGSVTDRDISGLQKNVDPGILTGNYSYHFMMSSELFLQNIVMPGLPYTYGHGTTAANFVMSGDTIAGKGNIECDPQRYGLIDYYPVISDLSIGIESGNLRTTAKGRFDITGLANAYVTFSIGSGNPCVFHPAQKTISFEADQNPTQNYDKYIPWYDWIAAALGGLIVLAIVAGVMYAVTSAVASSVSKSINANGNISVAHDVPYNVSWNGLTNFDVKEAGLSDAFYMKGN